MRPFFMDYDPERVMHVISNLLSNAIKFTPNGGTIELRIEERKEEKGLDTWYSW